ncbi:MAG: hypothetical protein GX303_00440, partial [Clostridiales bacterium]|nr:hypothetical protein [Clostridiales bacterium]
PGNIITDPPPVSDGYPSVLFDFKAKNKEEIEKKVASNPVDCTIEFLEDALLATSTVNNANWRYGLNADVHIALAQYVKFRIKNETASEEFEMWYHPEINNTSMPGSFRMPISTKDTEYKEYIFKMTDCVASGMYVRNLGTLRIDFAEAPRPATGEKFYIDYIAFFATQEEAEHFNIVEYRAGTWKPLTPGTTETTTATGGTTTPPTFDALPVYIMTAIPAAALITFAFRAKRRIYSR